MTNLVPALLTEIGKDQMDLRDSIKRKKYNLQVHEMIYVGQEVELPTTDDLVARGELTIINPSKGEVKIGGVSYKISDLRSTVIEFDMKKKENYLEVRR